MKKYMIETKLLNFRDPRFDRLFQERGWEDLPEEEKIRGIYNFVRDEIRFGYNRKDDMPSSEILDDGYGQCNTKGILLMSLLRKAGIPCRFHGFTIDKALQKGAITGIWYRLSPPSIVHSWVEVFYKERWFNLEGFILDRPYLEQIQKNNPGVRKFCGFGIATTNLIAPEVDWELCDTYIQKEGINKDFGLFDSPDQFFQHHRQKLGPLKGWLYRSLVRKLMNRNVRNIRNP